jgi:PEP-CTERM motif
MTVRTRCTWMFLAAVAVLAAGRADAFDIVFDGPGGYGISPATAANAEAAGLSIIEVASISQAAALDLTIPAPEVLSFVLQQSPSVGNPNTATSRWTVTNSGAGDLSGTWLVFLNPKPENYTATKVGFDIDADAGWAVIDVFVPMGKSGIDYFYPAVYLGNIGAEDSTTFLMHHLVGQALHQAGNNTLELPQYSVGALQGLPVPEPAALLLLAVGVALAAGSKRRNA